LWILFGFAALGLIGALCVQETYCRYQHVSHT
jgi:hypothetical protein